MISGRLSGRTSALWLLRISLHLFTFFFWCRYLCKMQLFILSKTLFLLILITNAESLIMKTWSLVSGLLFFVACACLIRVFDDAIGSYEQMGFKRLLSQTGYR